MRLNFFLIFIIIHFISFGQTVDTPNYLELHEEETEYYIEDYVEYYIDFTRSLSFEEVKKKKFYKLQKPPNETESIIWYKFYAIPKITSKQLIFTPNIVDRSDVYMPYKNDYKQFEVGVYTNRKIKYDITDTCSLNFVVDSIDFSKPIYFNKRLLTLTGKEYLENSGFLILTDNINNWYHKNIIENSYNSSFKLFLVVFLISFLLFLVNYIVTKDRNFLHYSLYLLFTSLIFITKFSVIRNFLSSTHPVLLSLITMSSVMASVTYFYFVVYFVELKNKNQKIYRLARYTIIASIFYVVFAIFRMIFIPYFSYRFVLPNIYNIIFLIISIVVFVYLMFTSLNISKRIVVIGSLFLIVGQILSVIFSYGFYFLAAAIIEIIIFSGVVSYQNRINYNEKIINDSALKIEKNKSENLQELDTAKSNFFTNISHEFRTPLTLISGPIQQQLNKNDLSSDERSNFEMVNRNTNRLLSLVDQLLDISKAESGNLKLHITNSEITPFIGSLADSFSFRAKNKKIDYKINIEPSTIDSWFDKDFLEKIITNLISNAVKYTPENGKIECTTTIKDNNLYFIIKNSGKGMRKGQLEKVFNRFYQISEDNKGTGIGLALVKELVTLHKGTIDVKSTPNDWTTFTVQLPITKKAFKESEITVHAVSNDQTEKQANYTNTIQTDSIIDNNTIDDDDDKPILLIVDDNADIRTYVSSIFKDSYTLLQAKNGQEGIDIAIEQVPDIIISDIMMPIKNGIELCNTLKVDERTSHIPIVLLTAKAGEENEIEGVKTGADDYITKPFNNELLKLKVEKLLENIKKLQERYSQEVILQATEISINSTDELFLNRLQGVLDGNLVESTFNTDAFCKSINMSRMQLHRKLKALFNMTTSEFIRSQRLKLAADLLKTSDVTVSQVGYSVGFNDPAYFSKRFKEMYNCTPTQYTKRNN